MNKPIPYVMIGAMLALLAWGGPATAAQWANPSLLVSADELETGMEKSNWVAVDCRDLKNYIAGHIPGAISLGKRCKKVFRDASARIFKDVTKYEKLLGKVGIGNDTHVVFYYDGLKTMNDATVGFWVMEYLGHDKVRILAIRIRDDCHGLEQAI